MNEIECEYDQDYDSIQVPQMHPSSPILMIDGTVLKESHNLDILECHLIPRLHLRIIVVRFPEQLLTDFIF